MAEYRRSLDIYQGYNFKKDKQSLVGFITKMKIGDTEMMHDPTAVTDGIEVSPDDQIIAARRGAYLVSLAERTGGWQRRGHAVATTA